MSTQPNIVLIMVDEMRGDCMGIAGHPDVKTPYLDTMASKGVYYPNAYTACPSCVPARAALYTGLSPAHTGRVGYQDRVDWNYSHTMASELTRAGYYTQCVGKLHVHPLRNYIGFHNVELHDGNLYCYRTNDIASNENQVWADDYFHWLRDHLGAGTYVNDSGLECNSWMARPWPYEERLHPSNWVAERSIDFLRRRDPRKPFFLMSSFVRPHAPYDAPQWYFDMYRDKNLRAPAYGDWDDRELLEKMGRIFNNQTGPIDPDLIRNQMIGYYACISHVDSQIGRILLALTEQKLMDNTVIIFTSDHGEMLSDHCLDRKGVAYQGSIHIPMIVYGPERLIGRQNAVDDSLVELRDVLPTMLELAGAEIPVHLDGSSMLHPIDRSYLHGEHMYINKKSNQFIVTKTDKYVWLTETNQEQYFDLVKDPREAHNAIADPEYADRIAELRNHLIHELEGRPEGYSDGKHLIPGCTPQCILPNATASI